MELYSIATNYTAKKQFTHVIVMKDNDFLMTQSEAMENSLIQ